VRRGGQVRVRDEDSALDTDGELIYVYLQASHVHSKNSLDQGMLGLEVDCCN
jgi:hypothetical protein